MQLLFVELTSLQNLKRHTFQCMNLAEMDNYKQ